MVIRLVLIAASFTGVFWMIMANYVRFLYTKNRDALYNVGIWVVTGTLMLILINTIIDSLNRPLILYIVNAHPVYHVGIHILNLKQIEEYLSSRDFIFFKKPIPRFKPQRGQGLYIPHHVPRLGILKRIVLMLGFMGLMAAIVILMTT